jgi:hypothetical protein
LFLFLWLNGKPSAMHIESSLDNIWHLLVLQQSLMTLKLGQLCVLVANQSSIFSVVWVNSTHGASLLLETPDQWKLEILVEQRL